MKADEAERWAEFIKQILIDFVGAPNTPGTKLAIEIRTQKFLLSETSRSMDKNG